MAIFVKKQNVNGPVKLVILATNDYRPLTTNNGSFIGFGLSFQRLVSKVINFIKQVSI